MRYSAVVYGEGQHFRLTSRALKQVMGEVKAVGAEYFGDLDPKGVAIPTDFTTKVNCRRCLLCRPPGSRFQVKRC
jgi:hypothetical protein